MITKRQTHNISHVDMGIEWAVDSGLVTLKPVMASFCSSESMFITLCYLHCKSGFDNDVTVVWHLPA